MTNISEVQAIAICRVSTPEQRLSNSLNRQEESVHKAAERLGVKVVRTWSGDASSKVGKNVKRKDLNEAFAFCKRNRRIKYLIVDEVDRFMRSTGEMFYWITKFDQEAGVQVYFASNPDHNTADAKARLLLSLEGFKAEGSNEERQHKSISGHEKAVREGRYTFPPKPGYKKGSEPGVHIHHPVTSKSFRKALKDVASGIKTPLDALKELNKSDFRKVHASWQMDKFRQFGSDPYYAGIIDIDKQVKARNENGRHVPLITIEEHERLVEIFNGRYKPRGPKKQYNPEFPLNKLLQCAECGGMFTGSRKSNGFFRQNGQPRKTIKYYWKYRCRGCGKEYHREEVHPAVSKQLGKIVSSGSQKDEFIKALEEVWEQKQKDKLRHIQSITDRIDKLNDTKSKLVQALVAAELSYKQDIQDEIIKVKEEISDLNSELQDLSDIERDLVEFVKFGLSYSNRIATDWWKMTHEDRVRCQQLIFPGGLKLNSYKKVSTHEISPIYRLATNKKDLLNAKKSLMVELAGNAPASDDLR